MIFFNFDSAKDDEKGVNGEDTALTIRGTLADLGITNIDGSMLALGAGDAIAESSLAKKLGIELVKLVDNKFNGSMPGFRGEREVADMYEYLSTHKEDRGLVTALGLEYVLEDRSNWARFWSGVKNVTTLNSLVIVYPHFKPKLNDDSFEILESGNIFVAKRIS